MPTRQNDQTHSNNFLSKAEQLFECVWPFWGVGTQRVKKMYALENVFTFIYFSINFDLAVAVDHH